MTQILMQVSAIPCSVFGEGDSILTVFRDVTAEKRSVEQSIQVRQQIINALVRAVESVPFLDGQTSLMRMLSLEVAETMLLSDADCATVEAASILSQMGKTFIPTNILQKVGKLTEEELLETKKYVEHTCRILEGVEFDLPITQTIWQIQENLDGSGYPNGLKGREISRLARILGVVNTFSALVKQRAHRKAKTAQEAVGILQSLADKKFDSTVIDALEAVIRSSKGREILECNDVEI
jgi:HD-GYP domain-containing protein (c-di-GMP phosphodiesterase class II)